LLAQLEQRALRHLEAELQASARYLAPTIGRARRAAVRGTRRAR
jgi:hypothetical protein